MTGAGTSVWTARRPDPLDPDQPTVVMFHGVGGDHSSWQPQARYLSQRGVNTVVPDLPGHGRTAGRGLGTVAELADWALDLVAGLGLERVHLAGHSLGSLLAIEMAAHRPELVDRIALVGAADRLRVHPALLDGVRDGDSTAIDLMVAWSFPAADTGGDPGPGLSARGAVRRLLEATPFPVLASSLGACDAYDAAARAGSVHAPALLISGAADRMAPRRAVEKLAGTLADARLVLLAGVGHAPTLQRPLEVASTLRDWFTRSGER